jgi:hypothetical protein
MLDGDFDAQCEALTLDMFCNHAFVIAVYMNGFQADAIKMQVLGNAFAAYDTAGLTEHSRKNCLDKAARLIHVLIGDNYLRVGKARRMGTTAPMPADCRCPVCSRARPIGPRGTSSHGR